MDKPPATSGIADAFRGQAGRFVTVWMILAAASLMLLLAKTISINGLPDRLELEQRDHVADMLARAQSGVRDLEADLALTARKTLESDYLTAANASSMDGAWLRELHAYFEQLDLPRQRSVELFDEHGGLLAWRGFGTVADPLAIEPTPKTGDVTIEPDLHGANVIYYWHKADGLGWLGVAQRVTKESRIENSRFNLVEEWGLADADQVVFMIGDSMLLSEQSAEWDHPVTISTGAVLGGLRVGEPDLASVTRLVRTRFDNVLAFFLTLLLVWTMFGVWIWYRSKIGHLRSLSEQVRLRERMPYLAGLVVTGVAFRYALLPINVPGRWFADHKFLGPFFDPANLGSSIGGDIARSIGDAAITSMAIFLLALAVCHFIVTNTFVAEPTGNLVQVWKKWLSRREKSSWPILIGILFLGCCVVMMILWAVGAVTQKIIIDSSLNYFGWTGLVPEPLVLITYGLLLLTMIAATLIGATVLWASFWSAGRFRPEPWYRKTMLPILALVAIVSIVLAHALTNMSVLIPWWTSVMFFATCVVVWLFVTTRTGDRIRILSVSGILVLALFTTGLLYPIFYRGMIEQRSIRVARQANEYHERESFYYLSLLFEDPVTDLAASPGVADFLASLPADSVAVPNATASAFAADLLADVQPMQDPRYDTEVLLLSEDGEVLGSSRRSSETPTQEQVRIDEILSGDPSPNGTYTDYSGGQFFLGHRVERDGNTVGWLAVATKREELRLARQGPVLRGADPVWRSEYPTAEYVDGMLRNGDSNTFGRIRLGDDVMEALKTNSSVLSEQEIHGTPYVIHYYQFDRDPTQSVIAIRSRSIIPYDHLYYLLRITVAGLFLGLPFYLLGLGLRWQMGLLPPPTMQFGDKVLNAFLGVGIVTVALMGLFGNQVIVRENAGAIQSRLERRLERVRTALERERRSGEEIHQVLDRKQLDDFAVELSLDLNVYRGDHLWATSESSELEEELDFNRLPMAVYRELVDEGYDQSFEEINPQIGTIGFQALRDSEGEVASVIAVLTTPEQERIREERARTTAYLFGALLGLLFMVMTTATLLANTLSRPIRRLRDGLKTVAAGKFQKPIPVETRDEVGELVRAFNEMQNQLMDSRKKLGQQERELAWREMAKQVAHEIKNPLTPMKLSIQHLQRARLDRGDEAEDIKRFESLFNRITGTLTDQIDTLARIANEFSTFARLPTRHVEIIDLNTALTDAANLIQEESSTKIQFNLSSAPLWVEADQEELRRVYINIIKNAVQAIGTDAGRVVVSSSSTNGTVYSSVSDTGPGIPEEIQKKIFQPNFSTKTSGMGLGLAITRKSVEDMGGKIEFDSVAGEGTTFRIELPLHQES